jgi:hypothetical protein
MQLAQLPSVFPTASKHATGPLALDKLHMLQVFVLPFRHAQRIVVHGRNQPLCGCRSSYVICCCRIKKIGEAEELEIASLRGDGTLRNPVTIWVLRVGDDLYVRSVNGRMSSWFRGVQERHEGRIEAGGVEKDVTFAELDAADAVNDEIDAVYRGKYRRYAAGIVNSILTPQARAATLKLTPCAPGS